MQRSFEPHLLRRNSQFLWSFFNSFRPLPDCRPSSQTYVSAILRSRSASVGLAQMRASVALSRAPQLKLGDAARTVPDSAIKPKARERERVASDIECRIIEVFLHEDTHFFAWQEFDKIDLVQCAMHAGPMHQFNFFVPYRQRRGAPR
jgi:hypothetical protein